MGRVVVILALLWAVPAHAQTVPDPNRTLKIPKVTTPPTLEDYLDGTPRAEEAAVTFSNNDYVGLMLDTFQDRRRAYLFIVNPLGVQLESPQPVDLGLCRVHRCLRQLEIDPLSRDRLRLTESVFHSTGRQLFVKVSYLRRF